MSKEKFFLLLLASIVILGLFVPIQVSAAGGGNLKGRVVVNGSPVEGVEVGMFGPVPAIYGIRLLTLRQLTQTGIFNLQAFQLTLIMSVSYLHQLKKTFFLMIIGPRQ